MSGSDQPATDQLAEALRERDEARRLAEQWRAAAMGAPVNWSLIEPLPWEESANDEVRRARRQPETPTTTEPHNEH